MIPPMTTVARGRCTSAPVPGDGRSPWRQGRARLRAHRAQRRGADLVRLQHQLVDRQPPEDALVLAGESAKVGARRREGAVRPYRLEEVVVDAQAEQRKGGEDRPIGASAADGHNQQQAAGE